MTTKYPKDIKGNKWTVTQLNALTIESKGVFLNDSDGLLGEVRVSAKNCISIAFRFGFKLQGKKVWHYCGTYPAVELSKIRTERDNARNLVKLGIDPRTKKIAEKIKKQDEINSIIAEAKQIEADIKSEIAKNLTFQDLYDVWIKDGVAREDGNEQLIMTFKNHALPKLANIYLRELSETNLLETLRSIFDQGKVRTAIMLFKDIGQMLRWAEKRMPYRALMIDGNPAELIDIENLIPSDYEDERDRILSEVEIYELKKIFTNGAIAYKNSPNKYQADRPLIKETQIALWLCLSTLCRIGELLMTEWKHVDFEAKTWYIPKENVKGTRKTRRSQLVYLSNFSLEQFKTLYAITGDSKWAFPAKKKKNDENITINHVCLKSVSKQVGDRQTKFKDRTKNLSKRVNDNTLVLGESDWTPHDLRRTGSTIMRKDLKISVPVINLCQNHSIGSKLDGIYIIDDYADEKREAWQKLGNRLEAILNSQKCECGLKLTLPN